MDIEGLPPGLENGASMKFSHVLGVRSPSGRCVEHLNDDTVLYLAGKHAAQYEHETGLHKFILKSNKTVEISSFCISANRKYIALAEKLADGMQVNVYTQTGSRVRTLEFKYLSKLPVVSMDFSTDNKYLATVTSLPDVFIYLWQVDKSRLVGMVDVPFELTKITVSPWSYWSLCTTGPSSIRMWRLVEKQLKQVDPMPKRRDVMANGAASGGGSNATVNRFSCHCWYDEEKVIAGTEEGDLLVFENSELKKTLKSVHGEAYAITAVAPVARGIVACGEGGMVSVFERTLDDNVYFRILKQFNPVSFMTAAMSSGSGGELSTNQQQQQSAHHHASSNQQLSLFTARIVDVSVAPKEEQLVILYNNNVISTVSLEAMEIVRTTAATMGSNAADNDGAVVSAAAGGVSNLSASHIARMLPIGFHNDVVSAVDVCVQKSFVVTGSLDKTIRVWNFMRQKVEFIKTFDEEVLCLALHPTGLRMLVGFKGNLRLYNVLAEDLHFCTEFPIKPCHEVRFSNGGQMFAAVVAHRILIFNSYDFQCTAQLSGHAVMIRSICWSLNDQLLTSADLNGIAYTWNIDTQKRVDIDDVRKNVCYNCVKYEDNTGIVAAMGTCRVAEGGSAEGEVTIRCIVPDQEPRIVRPGLVSNRVPSQRKQHTTEIAVSALAQTLFAGMPNGALYLYTFPLSEDAQPYQKIEVHSGEISHVILSADERYLFTIGGDDNTLFMFEVDAICEGRSVSKKPLNYAAFDDVCYVLYSDVDDKARELSALQQELEDLQAAKRRDEANLLKRFEQERSVIEKETSTLLDSLHRQVDTAESAKDNAERALSENARLLESMHLKAAEELEALYTKRTEEANAKYLQLKTERDDLIVRYENKLFKIQKEHEADKRVLDDKFREMELRLGSQIDSMKKRLTGDTQVHDHMLDQTIADYETMLDDLHAKYKVILAKKEEDLSKAINNSSTGERDSDRLRREKAALLAQLKEREGQIHELELSLDKRKKENESLRKEMLVRFESISTAEKKIQQLKKQTTELEKLRYVLTFKFNELKKEVAPKEKQIDFMSNRVEEMDGELEKVATDREQLKQLVEQRDERIRVLHKEIGHHRRNVEDKDRAMGQLLRELTELLGSGGTKTLVYQVKDLILKYNSRAERSPLDDEISALGGGSGSAPPEEDKTAEFERQREYMEAQLTCISRQNKQKESNLRLDNQRNTAENAILVREINELRHEKMQLATKCQLIEGQLKEARIALQRATAVSGNNNSHHSAGSPTDAFVHELAHETNLSASSPVPHQSSRAIPGSRRGVSSSGANGGAATPSQRLGGGGQNNAQTGRLIKGPTRALRDIAHLDSDKISRIITQVERNNVEMERQQDEIIRLREFVGHLLTRAETATGTAAVSTSDKAKYAEIKRHLQEQSSLQHQQA
ncbi:WD40 repeat-containing protein, putative [Bodo saltans]|uniref:WD40 repeat-containing protein, putative n=1 Tax=Bodo saltans TaxID=75058 RepID=A0A0S4JD05_BODSA|nr:WD40 repeat-containing protein, putative [Bodo saltans]|eukprot:CUG89431.1 WD40 repeat-containing protein, putative [Bodo saltans]